MPAELEARVESLAAAGELVVVRESAKALSKLVGANAVHQGLVACCDPPSLLMEADLFPLLDQQPAPLLLILDQVQDPHNLGACLRSANAMGATAVIIPQNNAVGLTAVVHKVACGASVMTPVVQVPNLARAMKALQQSGVWIVGLAAEGDVNLSEVDLSGSVAIAMGGEAKGLRALTRQHCDYLAKIPMQGSVESLNVSVASGVALYEVSRQRQFS